MKKITLIIVVAFLSIMALSSCNKQACPAYSQAESAGTESIG